MTEKEWIKQASEELVGRKIVKVEWLPKDDAKKFGWHKRPIVLVLENGGYLFPMQDDEGNDGGALATSSEMETWPVLSIDHDKMVKRLRVPRERDEKGKIIYKQKE